MQAFAIGIVTAVTVMLIFSQAAVMSGLERPSGDGIGVAWLLMCNVASLAGAAAVAGYSRHVQKALVLPAMLVWGTTTVLFMAALQQPADETITVVRLTQE